MQLHDIISSARRKQEKRIGRGGKRGTYSGKGQKGQRARAGHRIRPAERDTLAKFPKLRGVKNASRAIRNRVVNVGDLERYFAPRTTITKEACVLQGMIRHRRDPVKILGDGAVNAAFTIVGIPVSPHAKAKIEKAGGTVHFKKIAKNT